MVDPIAAALEMLDNEAPRKGIGHVGDLSDPRRRSYNVPTMNERRQVVHATAVRDDLFGERLDFFSTAMRAMPADGRLIVGLLALSREFRRARLCVFDPQRPTLTVVASFVPNEIYEGAGQRLLHALREVAAIADSLEGQLTGADQE